MLLQKSKSIEIFLGRNTLFNKHQIKLAYTAWNAFLLRFSHKPVIPICIKSNNGVDNIVV